MRDQHKRLAKAAQALSSVAIGEDWGKHWDYLLEANKSFGHDDEGALALTIRESGSRVEFIEMQRQRARSRLEMGSE